MKRLAVITARGGSKRIPRKNIRLFLDKPIIAYSIEAALTSKLFDEVMVSTDDEEIAECGKSYGAKVPFMRSERNANDYATTADVILEVINSYNKCNIDFDEICCIYPTAPFVTSCNLIEAQKILAQNGADCVMPVVQFSFPPQRGIIVEGGMIQPKWPEYIKERSQDLQPMYHDAGQFYFMNKNSFINQKSIIMNHTCPLELSELQVQDIDTLRDWEMAELKYQFMQKTMRK